MNSLASGATDTGRLGIDHSMQSCSSLGCLVGRRAAPCSHLLQAGRHPVKNPDGTPIHC